MFLAVAGYVGPPPFTSATALSQWEFDPWLAAGVTVVAVLYAWGVVRLRRRGHRWAAGRSVAFGVGLLLIVLATMSSLGAYDDTLFSVHMVQHMVLSMVAPVFLALGAPVTLALRALTRTPRRAVLAVVHSRVARFFTLPPIAWAHFVLLPFVLYHTGWYAATLHNDLLHEWLHVQLLAAGCLFFWPLLGLDPIPGRVSYPFRLLMTFLALPFHAILGLSIMMQTSLIAGSYYAALGRPWGPTLAADQYTAGSILWSTGDLVGLLLFGTLFFQWQRADGRKAARDDRQLDRVERRASAPVPVGGAVVTSEPQLQRPWWEVDAGPLAERARRERWSQG